MLMRKRLGPASITGTFGAHSYYGKERGRLMCRVRMFAVALAVIVLSGCYHATVNTGIEPGARQVQQPWAKSFVYGLVPPDPLNVMDECDDAGVASVETQLSFLNQIVSLLTLGIFTPMEITVTCGDD